MVHRARPSAPGSHPIPAQTPNAEQLVADKVARFGRLRRQLAYALARRHSVAMPREVEQFFDAIESGNWDAIEAHFKLINGGDSSAGHGAGRLPAVQDVWPAVIDAYGAAEQAHLWPAQQLLDYGNGILNALPPGMVYVGGTDNGRWIPELLNDTSEGEQHMVLTQNGLADASYLDYLRLLYGDRLALPTEEDSQRAFSDYVSDAQKRLEHDQQFPDEPKQVQPGEQIQVVDGRTEVSGQVAVMKINEQILTALMQQNPAQSFALQESFPFKSTYAGALPLGPIMELRASDAQTGFTDELAAQTLDYWQEASQQVLSDPVAFNSSAVLNSYSHDAVAAANLLAARNYPGQAEQAYRIASALAPYNPEAINGLAQMLGLAGRVSEAQQLVDDFRRNYPDVHIAEGNWRATITAPPSEGR